jgi:hypothetical protein
MSSAAFFKIVFEASKCITNDFSFLKLLLLFSRHRREIVGRFSNVHCTVKLVPSRVVFFEM